MRLARWLVLLALIFTSPAWAQSAVLQAGPVTPGHVPMYLNSGGAQPVVQDSGPAGGGASGLGLGELGITARGTGTAPFVAQGTGPNKEIACLNDAPTTNATGYHALCFSPNDQGGGLLSYGAYGTASVLPFQFLINGQLQSPATATGYVAGSALCFSTNSQAIVPCPQQPGTLSYQNASALNVTGVVKLTGVPAPTSASDATPKSYVDSVAVGLHPLVATNFVTIAALPTNTYSNGTLGVGATLTATANAALTVDGQAVTAAQTVLVNNEVAPANNGIYTVTQAGTGSTPYILTRATYFDQSAEMIANSYTAITSGASEAGSSWILAAVVPTVGTSAVNFNLFTTSALSSLPNGTIYVGNASGVATSRTVSGDGTLSNTGALTVTKTSGVAFAASATTDTTVATNITTGTLPAAQLPGFGFGDVSFASAGGAGTIAGNAVTNAKLAQAVTATIKGNNGTSTANVADLTTAQVRVMPGITEAGHIFGLTLANDAGTPATVIDIAAGEAASDDSTPTLMVLGSAFTKAVNTAWAVGSGNGCLDTGVLANTTYAVYEIERVDTGVVDLLCSTSSTAPTMPTNYTEKRRIGNIIVASSTIKQFVQDGSRFYWKTTSGLTPEYNSSSSRAKSALTVNVPSGIRVEGIFQGQFGGNAPGNGILTWFDGVNTGASKFLQGGNAGSGGNGTAASVFTQFTNTSAQIQFSFAPSGGGGTGTTTTLGWIDPRGGQ